MDQGRDRNVLSVRRPVMQKARGNNSHGKTPAVFMGIVLLYEIWYKLKENNKKINSSLPYPHPHLKKYEVVDYSSVVWFA
jgi:hypothetical protein